MADDKRITDEAMENERAIDKAMAEFETMRLGLVIVTMFLIIIASIAASILSNNGIGLAVFFILTILFASNAIRYFPNNPPTRWIPQLRGEYANRLKNWGLTVLPWVSPLTIGFTEMPGGIMHVDFTPEEMIPDDRVTVVIPTHLYYEVDSENPVQVILLGGIEKAAELLQENIDKLLRQWVTHPERGPEKLDNSKMTLDRVRRMNNEAINYILEELARDDIAIIPSEIPVEALMGYFERRILSPREKALTDGIKDMPEEEREKLREAVNARMEDIEALRAGKKTIEVQSTGLRVRQMVVDNIEAAGLSAAAVAKVAEANFDAEIKQIEAQALADQATKLKPVTTTLDPVQAALILNGTVKENIDVKRFDLGESTLGVANSLGQAVIGAIFGRTSGRKENGNDNASASDSTNPSNGKQ